MSLRALASTLLAILTLGFAVGWGLSLRAYYSAAVSTPSFSFALDLDHGTVGGFLFGDAGGWDLTVQSIPDDERIGELDESGPWGKFAMGTLKNPGRPPDLYVEFPIWVPYLLLACGMLAAAAVMKRRGTSGKEKELAESHASSSPAP